MATIQEILNDSFDSGSLKVTSTGGTLSGLTDTNISSPADTEVLTYDSATSKWVNAAAGGGGGATVYTATGVGVRGATPGIDPNTLTIQIKDTSGVNIEQSVEVVLFRLGGSNPDTELTFTTGSAVAYADFNAHAYIVTTDATGKAEATVEISGGSFILFGIIGHNIVTNMGTAYIPVESL